MWRRMFCLVVAAVVLGLVNNAFAADYTWTNTTGNANWCNAGNWDPDSGPPEGSSAMAFIDERSPNRGPIVPIGCNVDSGITGPEPNWGHVQVIDINTSGTVNIRGDWMWTMEEAPGGAGTAIININGTPTITIGGLWRGGDYGVGIVNIDGDPNISVDDDFRGADGGTGSFYINMSGGRLECQDDLLWGDNGGGELNLSGGSLIVGDDLDLGGYRGAAPITTNMTDGSISVGGKLLAPGSVHRAGVVRINLYGGVIDCGEFVHGGSDGGEDEAPSDPTFTDDWRLDIEQGILIIDGNVTATINDNIAGGQISAYDYDGTVVVIHDDVNDRTVVTGLPPDPNRALNPYPPRGSTMVDPNVVLSWTPGVSATEHLVFFGTTFQEVNEMTDPCATKPLGQESYYPGPLELETTYYWRVDANNGGLFRGRVWYFTTKSPIIDPNMLLWLKLNESSGRHAKDSSGYGNHGAVDGNELGWDPCDGHPHDGGCRNFTGLGDDGDETGTTVIDIQSMTLLNTIDDSITVAVWLKDAYNTDGDDNWVFHSGGGGAGGPYQVGAVVVTDDLEPEGEALWRAGSDTNDVLRWDLNGRNPQTLEGWHLWCFVKDENVDEMRIYFDGLMVKDRSGTFDTLVEVHDVAFKIGSASWENYGYMGKQDDFRLYDYALPDKKIEELYRGGDIGRAWAPTPGDYQEDVDRDANLAWEPGKYIQDTNGHEVYFGESWEDVNKMSEPCSVQDACEYDPGTLELEATYFWRINEVNDGPPAHPNSPWRGPIWRFTVANFIVVDNFEQYGETSNTIQDAWCDGAACQTDPFTGSHVELAKEEHGKPVHTHEQAMAYTYNTNDPFACGWYGYCWAEAWLPFDPPMDWTHSDVKLLTLFFYGDQDNDANDTEQMYVSVEDSDGLYAEIRYGDYRGENMNDLKKEQWQRWDIVLSDFNDSNYATVPNNVDLRDVNRFYIGFGDRRNPVAAGSGKVYFDDIRLYLPVCKPEFGPPHDLSGNCIVDMADIAEMGVQWLLTDAYLDVEEPCDANLIGYWKLDEGTGTFAEDSSDNDNHGTVEETDEGGYSWTVGQDGNAVEFDGGRVAVDDTNDLKPKREVSVCAWINIREDMDAARVVVKGKNDYESYEIEVDDDDSFIFQFRDNNLPDPTRHDVNAVVWADDWIHLAGMYDGSTIACYVNGQLQDSKDANTDPYGLSQNIGGFAIGNKVKGDANDTPFLGTIDEVRVYDYGLSAAEVAWLATGESGYSALTAPAEFRDAEPQGQRAINLKDMAELLNHWLERKFWPE